MAYATDRRIQVSCTTVGAVMSVEPVVIWLIIAVIAAIGEVVTFDLFMACIAVAAVLAGSIAFATPAVLQLVVFAGASAGGIIGVRPTVKRMLGIESLASAPSTLASHISGRRAVVSRDVTAHGGQIRIGQERILDGAIV